MDPVSWWDGNTRYALAVRDTLLRDLLQLYSLIWGDPSARLSVLVLFRLSTDQGEWWADADLTLPPLHLLSFLV